MDKQQDTTKWRGIFIIGIISFLSAVEDNIIGISEWPYMHTIDAKATTSFFGVANSMAHIAHAIFALLFALWRHQVGTTRYPLIAGRIISLIGCLIYLGVEILPSNRRYLMMLCYFLFGAGFGYIAESSRDDDRSRAYAITTAANLLAIVLGPLIQLMFSGSAFRYPGKEIIEGKIRFNMFSAPIWFAFGMNLAALLILVLIFEDNKKLRKAKFAFDSETPRRFVKKLKSADIAWPVVGVCLFEVAVVRISNVSVGSVASPLFMAGFSWSSAKTIIAMSLGQLTVGVICIVVAMLFIFGRVGQRVHPRFIFLTGLLLLLAMYVVVYPWPGISVSPVPYNETTHTGCNPAEYAWCHKVIPQPVLYIGALVLVMGLAMPSLIISLDTIYSKVQGSTDQSAMQGVFMVTEDLVQTVGTIYSTSLFSASGMDAVWIVNGSVALCGVLLWIAFLRKLKPFK